MASTIGGSLFAAVAFLGAGYLFHFLDKGGYSSEMKRHNRTMENLSKAKEAWYKEEVRKKDDIAKKRQELLSANADLSIVDKALDALRTITLTYHKDNGRKRTFTKRPELSDFYKPSTEMKKYQSLAMGVFGAGSGMILGLLDRLENS